MEGMNILCPYNCAKVSTYGLQLSLAFIWILQMTPFAQQNMIEGKYGHVENWH